MVLVPTTDGFVIQSGAAQTRFTPEPAAGDDVYRGQNAYHAGERLEVHRDDDGLARWLEVATFVYTRTPYDPKAPIPGRMPEPL